MKYYEMHESCYQEIQESGKLDWNQSESLIELLNDDLNTNLNEMLGMIDYDLVDKTVLDLGCGTGNVSLFCANKGAKCIGIDSSQTAIQMARKNSANLGREIEYICADLTQFQPLDRFDFVSDSAFSHCLIGQKDRERYYQLLKNNLKADGLFFTLTMISTPEMKFDQNYLYFDGDVLWSTGFPEILNGRFSINGSSYFPHRTILSEDKLRDEWRQHNIEIVCEKIETHDNGPGNFIAIGRML